jgi:N-sulfoglucosamine sulfohydrolase
MRPFACLAAVLMAVAIVSHADDKRPNIVMLVAEDISPEYFSCYDAKVAKTPIIDKLASQGVRFMHAYSHAPVCAPTRSGMITGRFPTSIGSHHMRSTLLHPPVLYTQLLQKAGYQVHWPGKTDFNFEVPKDAFTTKTDFRKVQNLKEPFFAYLNFMITHESQFRIPKPEHLKRTPRVTDEQRQDQSKVPIPEYLPDTPEVRKDISQHLEDATQLDYEIGDVLKFLDEKGYADNTIVVFWGDHGSALPRGKRWLYDSGVRIPLIMRWPGHIQPGTVRDDLACVLDFAPTFLSLAGAEAPPEWNGRVLVGDKTQPEPKYVFGARDRMDENYDRCRYVHDKRFEYIRNFDWKTPWGVYQIYNFITPSMQVWYHLAAEKKLNSTQMIFWSNEKPQEELYDVENDPYEVHNLADDPAYAEQLKTMRAALDTWLVETKDMGGIPEQELVDKGIVADRYNTEYKKRILDNAETAKKFPWPPQIVK